MAGEAELRCSIQSTWKSSACVSEAGICGRAIGSCDGELVAAFLCLVGGGLSRHPFVDTSGPRAQRLPQWRDTEWVLRLSRGQRGVLIRLTFCDRRRVMTTPQRSEQGATSNCPTVARVRPLEGGWTKTIPQLLVVRSPSPEWMMVRVSGLRRGRVHELKAGLVAVAGSGFRC